MRRTAAAEHKYGSNIIGKNDTTKFNTSDDDPISNDVVTTKEMDQLYGEVLNVNNVDTPNLKLLASVVDTIDQSYSAVVSEHASSGKPAQDMGSGNPYSHEQLSTDDW